MVQEAEWQGVVEPGSMWSFARKNSVKQKMRECYNDITSGNKPDTCKYALELQDRFSEEKMYADFVSSVESAFTEEQSQVIVL